MTTRIAIPLQSLKEFALQYDDPNTSIVTQDLLLEFEQIFGSYDYDNIKDEIFWNVKDNIYIEFKEELGEELCIKLHKFLTATSL